MALILLIEDNPVQSKIAQKVLDTIGVTHIVASNGLEGINMALQHQPDIIISDGLMPYLNGFHVCQILKKFPNTKDIPFILLTSLNHKIDKFWAEQMAADAFVEKSRMAQELPRILNQFIDKIDNGITKNNYSETRELEPLEAVDKATQILDTLLKHSTISNLFRSVLNKADNPDAAIDQIFKNLNSVLDFRVAIVSLPILSEKVESGSFVLPVYRGVIDYIYPLNTTADEIDSIIQSLERNHNSEQKFVQEIPDSQTPNKTAYSHIHLFRNEKLFLGHLIVQFDNTPSEQTKWILDIIQTELQQVLDVIVKNYRIQEMQGAFKTAHQHTELFLTSISNILVSLDENKLITRWNAAATEVFQIHSNEAIGRLISDLDINWGDTNIMALIEACTGQSKPVKMDEITILDNEKRQQFISLTINYVKAKPPAKGGYILVGDDISDHKALQVQLQQAQKMEGIGQLAAGVAHEINTPIQFIGSNISFLAESWEDFKLCLNTTKSVKTGNTENIEESIKDLAMEDIDFLLDEIPATLSESQEGIGRVAKIVRSMKEFAHPGGQEKQPYDINHVIDTTVTVSRNEWRYVLDINLELDPDLPSIMCRPDLLSQVFLNLIINATHAIQDEQEKTEKQGSITIRTIRKDPLVRLEFQDTGSGIPKELGERIFDLFFTTKEVGKGTGQGLALAYSVVTKEHGGKIWYESKEGIGTTFFIDLPLH